MNKEQIEFIYKKWCKETKRSGGILIGKSIHEFFEVLAEIDSRPKPKPDAFYDRLFKFNLWSKSSTKFHS